MLNRLTLGETCRLGNETLTWDECNSMRGTMPRGVWIEYKKDHPPETGFYWVYAQVHNHIGVYEAYYEEMETDFTHWKPWNTDEGDIHKVTHYMAYHMPTPPKKRQNSKTKNHKPDGSIYNPLPFEDWSYWDYAIPSHCMDREVVA